MTNQFELRENNIFYNFRRFYTLFLNIKANQEDDDDDDDSSSNAIPTILSKSFASATFPAASNTSALCLAILELLLVGLSQCV